MYVVLADVAVPPTVALIGVAPAAVGVDIDIDRFL
jgi:hypothetical protein